MAWNQPGKGNQDPWKGKDPGNEVEAFVNRLKGMFGGGGGAGRGRGSSSQGGFNPLPWVIGLLGIWLVFNSFRLMDERQRGVVLRFGEFDRIMTPGPNFKWPWPIESVYIVDATQVVELSDQVRVLTQDENLIDIKFNVQFRRDDPRTYLFGSVNPEQTLRDSAESAVREVVGRSTMDTVLFDRAALVISSQERLQESLNFYQTGLTVVNFNLQDARPPEEVKEAFDDAIAAREDKNRIENEARAYASKVVPEARGVAARLRTEAEGYRASAIARAEGDAQRFSLLVAEYRKAPEVTRQRLYLETMQDVLAANPKVMAGDNNILYLPMGGSTSRGVPAEAPVLRLPATQVVPEPTPDPRDTRRQGGR
ncbi:FtsH protease activity modulator HflK [Arenimonas caeni]|jgi:membrane protease subunit HflK|uniref:FtsH protease activity modulator HflK n=1 Tax=Arenimonas caeni TaxID=2058085 RepID=UPI002A36017F|nr:FtsH protease activity modulator HflK [Arenimonas caeni]MDY0021941.1 FtsH protease activity modulator HflK [Arenimonas caeni]